MGGCVSKTPSKDHKQQIYLTYLNYCLSKATPSKMIQKQTLQRQKQKLKISKSKLFTFDASSSQLAFLQTDPDLKTRWKLLIFCSGNDIYNDTYSGQNLKHQRFHDIQKDIDRTFPDQEFFIAAENRQKLSKVLKNIALYFPKVGYTQGINFIIGFLLLCGFNTTETFWIFTYLSTNENFMMMGMFEQRFPLAFIFTEIFQSILQTKMPDLLQKVKQLDLPKQAWIIHWFLTYFIIGFPLDIVKMFWDYIFVRGSIAIVYLSVAVLVQIRPALMEINEDAEFIEYFKKLKERQFIKNNIKIEQLFEQARRSELNPDQISFIIKKSQHKNIYVELYSNLNSAERKTEIMQRYINNLSKQRAYYFSPKYQSIKLKKSLLTFQNTNPVYYYMLSQRSTKITQVKLPHNMMHSDVPKKGLVLSQIKESLLEHKTQNNIAEEYGLDIDETQSRIFETHPQLMTSVYTNSGK